MRGLEHSHPLIPRRSAVLPTSRLARHVSQFGSRFIPIELTRTQLQQMSRSMPFLRELHLAPQSSASGADWSAVDRLPSSLTTVHVAVHRLAAASLSALIAMFSAHQPLLDLQLWLPQPGESTADVSFAPLRALSHLLILRLHTHGQRDVSVAQAQELRALTRLKVLEFMCSKEQLLQLLEPPSNRQVQWTQLPNAYALSDAVAALLPPMPRLSHVSIEAFPPSLTSLAFLTNLPALTSLDLTADMGHDGEAQRMDALLLALAVPLPGVRRFQLHASNLHSAQLQTLLSLLPRLECLELGDMYAFEDLTFLEPVRNTLRVLSLARCRHSDLTPGKLLALRPFQLTDLSLDNSLSEPLDELSLLSLTPPSILIPSLQTFHHADFIDEDADDSD